MSTDHAKQLLRRMPYGFYALTSRSGDDVNAMVVNWITQASFEPRLIAVAIQKTCHSYTLIRDGKAFNLNLFLQRDEELIKPFTKGRAKNPDKMKAAKYTEAPETGLPILEGAAGYLECKVLDLFETGGDHDIFLGEVVGAEVLKKGEVEESLNLPEVGWSYAG